MKKLLTAASVAALLSASAVSFANGDGYVAPMPVDHASDAGFYMGLQLGYGDTNWDNLDTTIAEINAEAGVPETPAAGASYLDLSIEDTTGFAGRIFAGYQFSEHFAVELGYTHFSKAELKEVATTFDNANPPVGTAVSAEESIKTHAFDLVGKLSAPFGDSGFGVYTKAGLGYLTTKFDADAAETFGAEDGENKHSNVNLVFGFGVDYQITDNIALDASWTHFEGHAEIDQDYQPDADLYAAGIIFKIPTDMM